MKTGKVLDTADIRKIIAEHFGVPEEKVIASKYSYIVLDDNSDKKDTETK